MNLVSMGMKYLAPVVITKLASMIGLKGPIATKLVAAALPTLLAMFAGKASNASGASALMDMISKQPDSDPDSFQQGLEGADATSMSASGADALTSLLGGSSMGQLTGALGKFGGASAGETTSLLGMIAPTALSTLKTQVTQNNLDAGGLAQLLESQKANISDAVPAEFASQVKGMGLIDNLSAPAAAMSAASAPAKSGGGLLKWLLPLVILAGLAWYFLGGNTDEMTDAAGDTAAFTVGDENIGDRFGTAVDGLKTTIGGITDTDTATAAIPQLEGFNTELDSIGELAGQLPEEQQGAFGGMVGTALESIKPLIEGAIESSGAGSILQPIVDTMFEKMAGMAG